jgi:hypothetical protein
VSGEWRYRHESHGIGKEDVPLLQDRPPQAGGARDLQGPAPQAAPRLIAGGVINIEN